jgi:hypothetical protein
VTEKTTLSFSRLSVVAQCLMKYRLRYVDEVDEEVSGAFIGGGAVHRAIEEAENDSLWTREDFADLSGDLFVRAWTEELGEREVTDYAAVRWGGRAMVVRDENGDEVLDEKGRRQYAREDHRWWARMGPKMIRHARAVRLHDAKTGVEVLPGSTEMKVGVNLGEHHVRGYIDVALLVDQSTGEVAIRDWKTGSGQADPAQLATYAWLIGKAKGWTVTRGEFAMLRKPDVGTIRQQHDLSRWLDLMEPRFLDLATTLRLAEENDNWPWNPSSFCKSCTVRRSCPWGQTLEDGEEAR